MEMSSIFHALGSHVTQRAEQIELWHRERLQEPAAPRSPLWHPVQSGPPQRSEVIDLRAALADGVGEFGGAGAPQIFLNNCEGFCELGRDGGQPRPCPSPLNQHQSLRLQPLLLWKEQGAEAATAPEGFAFHSPVCSCSYSLWNKLPSQEHITHPKFFSSLKEKLNCQVL